MACVKEVFEKRLTLSNFPKSMETGMINAPQERMAMFLIVRSLINNVILMIISQIQKDARMNGSPFFVDARFV